MTLHLPASTLERPWLFPTFARSGALAILFAALVACSGVDDPQGDTGVDAGDDSGDAGGDAGDDSGGPDPDVAPDGDTSLPDADTDTGVDTDTDEGSDTGDDADVPVVDPNACGGEGPLEYEGAPADAGDACGCGGFLTCSDGALACLGNTPPNACGGCADLGSERPLDGACGPCGDGAWACDGTDALTCEGASAGTNACGGCADLGADVPLTLCDDEDGSGLWVCTSTDSLTCIGAGRNDCGGLTTLGGTVGAPCGACGAGRYTCDGRDAVICSDDSAGLNACGGCAPLAGDVGSACGSCGGTWQCDAANENRVVCSAPPRNACGGCDALSGGAGPGETCDEGATYCDGPNGLGCGEASLNACGGRETLTQAPGTTCGACGDGVAVCAGRDTVVCIDATPVNACGTCERLSGTPGAECAFNHTWQCTSAGNVSCRPARRVGILDDSGGSITFGDASSATEGDGVSLSVGAGSVSEPVAITIELSDLTEIPGFELTSPSYRFLPEGQEFVTPIRVRFGTRETVGVDMWWSEQTGDGYDAVESQIDGRFIEGYVDHFSIGFAGRRVGAPVTENCSDGVDNDGDGDIDCDDDDCADHAACDEEGFVCLIPRDCEDPRCIDDPGCEPSGEDDFFADPCARVSCDAPLECIAGACIPLFDETSWPPEGSRFSFVRSVQVPPRNTEAECCFDLTGNGRIDNGLAGLVASLGAFGGDLDFEALLDEMIDDDLLTLLFEWREDGAVWIWSATNDLDGDGEPDQTPDDRSDGIGVFALTGELQTEYGTRLQLNDVSWAEGRFVTGTGVVPYVFPTDGGSASLFPGGVTPAPGRMVGELLELDGQRWSVDPEIDVDGEPIAFGGIEVGGFLPLDTLFAGIDAQLRGCECAGFDPSRPVIETNETDDRYIALCVQSPGGGCTEVDGAVCENASLYCSMLGTLGSLWGDVDSNGNGVIDAMSFGLRISLTGAQVVE